MARKKAGELKIKVGNIADVSGEVTIAGGDIYKGFTSEQVSVLIKQITTTFQPKKFDGRCPYKGLDVFEEEDAELFFGREKSVDDLVSRVNESRAVFITGPSGSGKSSLVRAGLIHALKQGAIKNSERWLNETMKPGRDPIGELARVASSIAGTLNAGEDIRTKGLSDATVLSQWCEIALKDSREKRVAIFIDQFEEVFTQIGKEEERVAFLNLLTHAATAENGRVILLFAMRSDFVSNCATYPQLNALLNQQFIQIGAMQPDELVSAIAQPALRVGLRIDPDLIAQIINDMQGEPGTLPLMQFALKDLFDSQQEKSGVIALTVIDYLQRGGIHKALERHADASFAKLDKHEQELARSIFSRLIEIGRGTQDTRRTALFDELMPANTKAEDVKAIVGKLADARLITTDEQAGKDTVTLAHEKLVDAWPWLKKLVNENRDAIALQNEIANDAKEWDDHQRDASYLYTGARLVNVREQLDAKKFVLSGLAQSFIEIGVKAYADELEAAHQRTAQLRQRSIYLSMALIAALIAVDVAVFLGFQSRKQAQIALARQLAAQAQFINTTRDTDHLIGVLLAVKSMQMFPSSEAAQVLEDNLLAKPIARMNHDDSVRIVAVSPNGKWIASGSDDDTARVWDAMTGKEISRMTHEGSVTSIAFSPDGKLVVSSSSDNTARIWDAETGQEIARITHGNPVNKVAFSPNGKWVLSGSDDRTIRVSDAKTGQEITRMVHNGMVKAMAFSPDGKWVVSGSNDKTSRVWNVLTGKEISRMTHDETVNAVAFSPNGKWVASGGDDGTPKVWEAETGREIAHFDFSGAYIYSIAFSPDGKWVVSGGANRTATVWEARTGTEIAHTLTNFAILTVVFSPDGKYVASGGDITARVWEAPTGKEIARMTHDSGVNSVAFSPDGKWVVSASDDNSVQVWEITNRQNVAYMTHDEGLYTVAISPNSKFIASGSWDNTARIWEIETGHEVSRMRYTGARFEGVVRDIGFSPDGKWVVSGDRDKTARVWNATTGKEISRMTHEGEVYSIAFSPDGKWIVSGSEDKTARVWNAITGREISRMTHEGEVYSVAFSRDGKWIVSGSEDNTVRMWNAITGEEISRMTHEDVVNVVAFSFDGKWIVSGSNDNTARVWDVETGIEISRKTFDDNIYHVAFSPDKKLVLSAGDSTTAYVWEAATGQEVSHMTHNNSVLSVAFSPDGKWVVSGSWDNTARVWDASTGKEVARVTHNDAVRSVTFSPNGKWVVSGGRDNIIRVWLWHPEDLIANVCSRLSNNLTRNEWNQYLGDEKYQAICPNLPIETDVSHIPVVPSLLPIPNPIPNPRSTP